MNPWLAIAIVMLALIAMIHTLSRLQKDLVPDPEAIRKILHVVMGMITLSFPWLFHDTWPVLTLSIVSSLFIALLKVSDMKDWKPVICARGRESIGEIAFPLAIGLTFLIADGNKLLYLIPTTILTFADAASALIGQRFGKRIYGTQGGAKSLEGSAAFIAVAFISTFLPLTLSGLDIVVSLTIAMTLSIVAMMFEAIGWKGLDNLFIPIGAILVLRSSLNLPLADLQIRLALLLVVSLFIVASRRNSTLNGSGVIGAALFCYFALVVGGFQFALLPAILYLTYRFLLPARFRQLKSVHSVYAVISVASVGLIWLLVNTVSNSEKFLFPYAMTFAAHAAIISTAHMRFTSFSKPRVFVLLYAVLKAWCLICIPLICMDPSRYNVALTVFLAPFCIGIPTLLFYAANSTELKPFTRPARWWKQASFAAIASILGLIPFLI